MIIRPMTEANWVEFFPTYAEVLEAGETYAFPPGQTLDEARGWWVESAPGITVVAVSEEGDLLGTNTVAVELWQSLGFAIIGTVPASFDSRAHGLVGLHVMHRYLQDSRGGRARGDALPPPAASFERDQRPDRPPLPACHS